MKMKEFFQKILIRIMSFKMYLLYINKHQLEAKVIDSLIDNPDLRYLKEYVEKYPLEAPQISRILREYSNIMIMDKLKIVQTVLRKNKLDEEQEMLLIEQNDVLFFENYLSPNGYFDVSRRFGHKGEVSYILKMAKSNQSVGIELFKAYVDNTSNDLMSDDLLQEIIKLPVTNQIKYLLQKTRFSKEQEVYLLENGQDEQIEVRIETNELQSDAAQLKLVEEHYPLAEMHFEKYKLRSKAQHVYYEKKHEKIEREQAEKLIAEEKGYCD